MAALTGPRDTEELMGYSSASGKRKFKLRGNRIYYAGAMLAISSLDSLVRPAGAGTTLSPAGRNPITVDTTGLADGVGEATLDYGAFGWQNNPDGAAGDTLFFEGEPAFMLDDQSVVKTSRTSTLSSAGRVAKVEWDGGQPCFLWGGRVAVGAAAAGDVHFTAKTNGVTVTIVDAAAAPLSVVVTDKAVVFTTDVGATTATALKTFVDSDSGAQATAARALLGVQLLGDGTGFLAALAAGAVGDGGGLAYFSKAASGCRVKHVVSGTNTALGISVTGSDITVTVATDGNKRPTTTAAALKTFLETDAGAGAVAARALVSARAYGAGTGIVGAWDFQACTYLFTGRGSQAFVAMP